MLDMAILGLLQEAPMHGYELRKELATKLGTIRAAISYGTLYPTLKRLKLAGWISEAAAEGDTEVVPVMTSKRGRVVYKITAEGKEHFADLLTQTGPETYDDAGFGVHFTFFSRTDRATRLRILEGRRRRIEERREGLREILARAANRLDAYTLELQRHGLEACEREVRWLEELITNERSGRAPAARNRAGLTGAPSTAPVADPTTTGAASPETPRPQQDRP
ncbi:PadR family transcriptional regulator [Actinoplanes couchii]|uniref:PadR family transcriptional regulator n=1 Tax=Actinoplanes couchii TaxID=403638 RepID=A0ABQ3XJG8_9ACTN|nr:PadR family transcriptional regulator [Actinoplanes couchii]MDR6324355.1 DNA-binding PadR family transcriptional regulator [Actinoplanes couchii]GID58645.1 PadR family transcriptional regulator [Actinoplanes couchii]